MNVELENSIEMPEENKPRKSRARRVRTKEPTSVDRLVKALKFISVVQKKSGTVEQQFCAMVNHWLIANNGVVMAGTKIEEDLFACPHTYQLLEALNKSRQEMNITQLSQAQLSVKSEKFKAIVPCVSFETLNFPAPDNKQVQVDNRIKAAFGAVATLATLATDGAEKAYLAAVCLQSGSAVATNGAAVLEYWHGFQFDGCRFMVPKVAAVAVAECEKDLVGIGYTQSSITFHFADESFIKTQLFNESFPEYAHFFNVQTNPWPLPEEFFKGVKSVKNFSKNGIVYFDNGCVSSREIESEASTYQVQNLPEGMAFHAKLLLQVQHAMVNVDFDKSRNNVIFFGNNVRGILAAVNIADTYQAGEEDNEDEVAF